MAAATTTVLPSGELSRPDKEASQRAPEKKPRKQGKSPPTQATVEVTEVASDLGFQQPRCTDKRRTALR